MSVSSISDFFHRLAEFSVSAFGQRLSESEWHILLAIGRHARHQCEGGQPAQSYKSLKVACALSDDALSRALRNLVSLGLIERNSEDQDQRVIRYSLTNLAERNLAQLARLVVQELGSMIFDLALQLPKPSPTSVSEPEQQVGVSDNSTH